jgi:hypothetical protein
MPPCVSLASMPPRENLVSLGCGRSIALVHGSGEHQHGADEMVDGGGQPGHTLLPGLPSRLHHVVTTLLYRHHLLVPVLLRSLPTKDSKTRTIPVFKTDRNWLINQKNQPKTICYSKLVPVFKTNPDRFVKNQENWTGFVDFKIPAPDSRAPPIGLPCKLASPRCLSDGGCAATASSASSTFVGDLSIYRMANRGFRSIYHDF